LAKTGGVERGDFGMHRNDEWAETVRLVNAQTDDHGLSRLGVNWSAEVIAASPTPLRSVGVLGSIPDFLKSSASFLGPGVDLFPLTLPALTRYRGGVDATALPRVPDVLLANFRGSRPGDLPPILTQLCSAGIPSLVEFDPEAAAKAPAWFTKIDSARVQVLDLSGEEIALAAGVSTLQAGCIALLPRGINSHSLTAAIKVCASRRTGVPRQSRRLESQPYVRTVEIVSLQTAARIGNFPYERRSLGVPNFNIYSRKFDAAPKMFELARCRNVDVIPHPAWKICLEDRYLVEEVGYSDKNQIVGMECWPEFGGTWAIRRQTPHVQVSSEDGPFFLLGGDAAYYHWLLNWVPRLMAADVMGDQLPPLSSLKLLVPHTQLLQVPQLVPLLYELGVPPENIVHLHENAVWRFEELLVPTFFFNGHLSASVARWYRHHVRPGPTSDGPKRILISRRDARPGGPPRRHVVNEEALAQALKPFGFECCELSTLSLRQQIDAFQRADFVVGPHGAGFANMVFSPVGTKALVLENTFNHTFMVDMINVAGGAARSLVCDDVIDSTYEAQHMMGGQADIETQRNRDMVVDIDALLSIVRVMSNE
jgi:hypothetical protein